jgi:ubiquinone/menaquinone biosynthesis C-methylase UbiE
MTSEKKPAHTFDPAQWRKLESPERRERMNPVLLAEVMGLTGAEVVLDIGVGTGFFAEEIAGRCLRLIGLDHSDDMLNVFRGKEVFGKLENVELKTAKADDLPFDDDSIDLVMHVNLFHEVGDVKKFHGEIRRVVKPGGRLFCVDWHARVTNGGPPLDHRVSIADALEMINRDLFSDIVEHNIYADQYVIEARV